MSWLENLSPSAQRELVHRALGNLGRIADSLEEISESLRVIVRPVATETSDAAVQVVDPTVCACPFPAVVTDTAGTRCQLCGRRPRLHV